MKMPKQQLIQLAPLLVSKAETMLLLGIQSERSLGRRIEERVLTPVYLGKSHMMFRYSEIKKVAGEKP